MEDLVMKKIFAIIATMFCTANLFASELVVKGNIDVPFSIFINGDKYYSYNNAINVTNLPAGSYGLEIYTEGASYELLYDYTITVPSHSTVYATFDGSNKMYIESERNTPAVVIDLTPYPRRALGPAHRPAVHHYAPEPNIHHSAPAPKHDMHKAAPAPKNDNHKTSPAPKNDNHKASPAPKNNDTKATTRSNNTKPSVSTSSHSSASKAPRSTATTRR